MQISIKSDAAVNDQYDFSNWVFDDDIVSPPQPFMPDTMYSQAPQSSQLCMAYDYMPYVSSYPADAMAPGYVLQASSSPYAVPDVSFDIAACNYYPTLMGPLATPTAAHLGCCVAPALSQEQALRHQNMLEGSSFPGHNMIAGQEWAMNSQQMVSHYTQMPPMSVADFPYGPPTPQHLYSYSAQTKSLHESRIPRSFDNRNRRRLKRSR